MVEKIMAEIYRQAHPSHGSSPVRSVTWPDFLAYFCVTRPVEYEVHVNAAGIAREPSPQSPDRVLPRMSRHATSPIPSKGSKIPKLSRTMSHSTGGRASADEGATSTITVQIEPGEVTLLRINGCSAQSIAASASKECLLAKTKTPIARLHR